MTTSALDLIQTGTVSQIALIPGISSSKAVPPYELFKPMPAAAAEEVLTVTLPDAYPGAVVSLNEDLISVVEVHQQLGGAWAIYRVPVYVALYATSDGTVAGEARRLVWSLGESVQRTLMAFSPSVPGITVWPLVPERIEQILVDANTHGLLMEFWAKYQLQGTPLN